jgi:replicative DNA helicase
MTLASIDSYGHGFQVKVISSLLTHKVFLQNIFDILNEEDFQNQAHRWIIKEILKYYDKYHCNVSMDVLKVELQKVENEVLKVSIKEQLKNAYKASNEDMEYVQEEFSNFLKNQQLKKALLQSVDLLKEGDYDSIKGLMDAAMKAGSEKNIGHEYLKDVESRFREDFRSPIATPWKAINDICQGGLGKGDFGLFFGSPGGGKSWLLVALGAFAAKMGYNVLHYTLELGEEYVGRRYDAFFTGIDVDKIQNHRPEVEKIMGELEGQVIIKEFAIGKASLQSLDSHHRKTKDLGFDPDLIIIDYVDLLRTKRKYNERKDEIDDNYRATKGWAKELDLPIWSVSQVNRAGAKDDIVEGDKAAGSYDKMMIADLSISLSRKRKDKVEGTGRFHVMKNRYGGDGMTYGVQANTATGCFVVEEEEWDEGDYIQPSNDPFSNSRFDDFDKGMLKKEFFSVKG